MSKFTMKYLDWAHTLLFIIAIILVATCTSYADDKATVAVLSNLAFLSLCGYAGLGLYMRSLNSEFKYSESVELSLLRQIRFQLREGLEVSVEQIEASEKAAAKADENYLKTHGFTRPAVAIAASAAPKTDT